MRTLTCVVGAEREGQPLRNVLRGDLQLSCSLLKSLKWREGAILLRGQSAHVNAVVHAGDEVRVLLSERRPAPVLGNAALVLSIVYEDEDLLVIDKPGGVAMHPRRGDPDAPDMASALAAYLNDGSAAHFVSRLDKGTSGLFIAAKTGYVHDRLRRSLHSDALRREYRAIALGRVTPERGVIDLPIGRAEDSIVRRCVRPDGLPSRTEYEVLAQNDGFSYLRLIPRTGRTHQLRLHLSALGHPLAGDWLYGTEDPALIARPALHSFELWFTQPVSGEKLRFTAPLPPDFRQLAEKSGLWGCEKPDKPQKFPF